MCAYYTKVFSIFRVYCR